MFAHIVNKMISLHIQYWALKKMYLVILRRVWHALLTGVPVTWIYAVPLAS